MHGRGRGAAGPMGRGRPMPNKQNLRVVECKPQPCVVSVEGLSSSTTDVQLKSLLTSVGPIQVGARLPAARPLPTSRPFVGHRVLKQHSEKKDRCFTYCAHLLSELLPQSWIIWKFSEPQLETLRYNYSNCTDFPLKPSRYLTVRIRTRTHRFSPMSALFRW